MSLCLDGKTKKLSQQYQQCWKKTNKESKTLHQRKRWNATAAYNKTMGRADRMDQNVSVYIINIRNKKWWSLLFRFCIDLAVNNAYQHYHLQPLQPGQRALDLLGFRREIVQVYCSKYRNVQKILPDISPGLGHHQKVIPGIRYDNANHWIIKGK